MQTSDLNVNNTESDHATAIFRQFQDAIFSREHTSVKTSTKIIFDLLQWQEVATLSLPKEATIASFISRTFLGYFRLGANDIARNRSRVIFSRACVDIFRRWSVWLPIIFCSCVNETTLFSLLRSLLREKWQIALLLEDIPLKRHGQLMHMRIRYNFLADFHVTRNRKPEAYPEYSKQTFEELN